MRPGISFLTLYVALDFRALALISLPDVRCRRVLYGKTVFAANSCMVWYYLGWNVLSNKLRWQNVVHPCMESLGSWEGKAQVSMLASCSAPSHSQRPWRQASPSPSGAILLQIGPLVTESGVRFYGTMFIKFFETLQRKIPLKTKTDTTKLLTKKDNPPRYLIPSMAQLWQIIPENSGQLYAEKQWVFLCFSTSPKKRSIADATNGFISRNHFLKDSASKPRLN